MTELLVGTKKGVFRLEGEPGTTFDVTARAFAGEPVEYAMRDPRSGRYIAATASPFYGPKIWLADDPTGEWQQADGVELPEEEGAALARIWVIVAGEKDGLLYAGGDPGVLFESRDGGATWAINEGLWNQPTRRDWTPGGGGLCLHTIATWPGDPDKLLVAISAVGIWLTDDGGQTWRHSNTGIVPRYLPEEAQDTPIQHCVHNVRRSTARPERLFLQFHGGVYRSDDAGETWLEVGVDSGLPSDFGFPICVDPADPDSAYVIPLTADLDRVTPDGSVRVYETRDAGASWGRVARGSHRSTRTSRSCERPSTVPARAIASSSTSAPPRATSSAPATRARRGRRQRRTSHPCTRCARPDRRAHALQRLHHTHLPAPRRSRERVGAASTTAAP